MQRRSFIKNAAFSAVAVSASGFIRFDGKKYISDCETTTDIIGPFYRPDSPVKNNLVIKGEPGILVELSGGVKHIDCTTPYKKAKVELWHCANNGLYDNTSDEFRYRGTTFTDNAGNYVFNTILPVPYNAAGGPMRPAHFHLMITAEGYRPLVTQLYFTNDPYLTSDPFSNSPNAKKRILEVQTTPEGKKKVLYDVSMAEKIDVEPASLNKLTGFYVDEDDKDITCEFFIHKNRLWYNAVFGKKLDPFGRVLVYGDKNIFHSPWLPERMMLMYAFEIMSKGSVKCTQTFVNDKGKKYINVFIKQK
jgi:protocatechuate 3,4-dioxygenase beta subunit